MSCQTEPLLYVVPDDESERDVLCGEAVDYIAACTGNHADITVPGLCTAQTAMQLLETPCEYIRQAYTGDVNEKADGPLGGAMSLTCRWFGVGCPPDDSCLPVLSAAAREELILWSEPESLAGPWDARERVNAIAQIFREEGDPRGLFATVYRLITNRAVESMEAGAYEHELWAGHLITEFARRYLRNLHGHLSGGKVTPFWSKYYRLSRDCRVGRGRTLGVAIAVHLMVDLPLTLRSIESMPEQREDFVLFGDVLFEVFPQLIIDVRADYDTDASDLLNGFFLGEWVDTLTSQGTMSAFLYQGVRMKAWRDSQNFLHYPAGVVMADIHTAWSLADLALAKLDACGAL
jgi:hypothetical protein